jgi:predicted small secreted protein
MKIAPKIILSFLLTAGIIVTGSDSFSRNVKSETGFLYNLSDFSGDIPYTFVKISLDKRNGELYVIDKGGISIFNKRGMKLYSFGEDGTYGRVIDVVSADNGSIFLLRYEKSEFSLLKCNFRGEKERVIKVTGLPDSFYRFRPHRVVMRGGRFYLADLGSLMVVVIDLEGGYLKGYDLAPLVGVPENERDENNLTGFDVDEEGNILFTISVLFRAFKLSPYGSIKSFGQPGNIPGKFSIVAGITSDGKGNILVVDKLKCVVMVFDEETFAFKREFGNRGLAPGELIAPSDLVVDDSGKVYVTQGRRRGVSVYRLNLD